MHPDQQCSTCHVACWCQCAPQLLLVLFVAGGRQLRLSVESRLKAKPRKWVLRVLKQQEVAEVNCPLFYLLGGGGVQGRVVH